MQLDQITATIRLRSSWEAVDLGFAMVQSNWRSIYPPLIIFNLLFLVPAFVFLPRAYYGYILLFFWWVKPYSHRLILHILSQKLFNNELSITQALGAVPALLHYSSFGALTFRRFSFSRGFNLPIWQLERLKSNVRRQRQHILLEKVHSQAVWLTISFAVMILILTASTVGIVLLFVPPELFDSLRQVFFDPRTQRLDATVFLISVGGIFVAVTLLIEPFYIAANFALYLNRRTQLEAWDLELSFRKMAQRLQASAQKLLSLSLVILATAVFSVSILSSPSEANTLDTIDQLPETSEIDYLNDTPLSVNQSKKIITEIINSNDLKSEETTTTWSLKDFERDKPSDDNPFLNLIGKIIATLFEYTLWILLVVVIMLLFLNRHHWLYLFSTETPTKDDYQAPDILFNMDVRETSLPADLIGVAQTLWQQQQFKACLSLLYRGALTQLIHKEKILLSKSHTEGDILKLSQSSLAPLQQDYLQQLTQAWQLIAYAHHQPSDQLMNHLFNHWMTDFATTESRS